MPKYGRRDSNETPIVKALRKAGCDVEIIGGKPYDLICGRGYRTYLLETKTPMGSLTDSQKTFRRLWRGHYAIVRSPEEALIAVGVLSANATR
jgi:hypothetical protein